MLDTLERRPVVRDLTDRDPTNDELELLATGRSRIHRTPDDRRVLIPVAGGGAVGTGAVYARNLPSAQGFVVDPVAFAMQTQKNMKPYPGMTWPGYGGRVEQRIDKVGVIGRLLITFIGTLTPAAMTATPTRAWPWNLVRRVKVSANGISNLFDVEGLDMRALARVRRKFFNDRESLFGVGTGGGAAQNIYLVWEVPIAFDESLMGAVFAQTEDTELVVTLEAASAAADLFSANAPTLAGSFSITSEFFSIPQVSARDGVKLLLPDVRQLHGMVSKNDILAGTGDHRVPLMRTGGVLLRAFQRIDNTTPGSDDPSTVVTSHRFRYGSNVVPFDSTGRVRQWEAQTDYGDRILPAADVVSGTAPFYMVDDFVEAGPLRDVVHLLGVSEPELLNTIATGTTINAGAVVHTVQEHMVAG